ncbi:MAG: radical SAM protein [Spirochaetes bacterium]|nr:radical SAM protein [Spirochaetota bacterium]
MKYLFGPVHSRRFGRSLGIDLLPKKICTMNCIYCECGETEVCTDAVFEYVPTNDVIEELAQYLSTKPMLDAVTFAGSGEPTLHSGIGTIINFLKTSFPEYRVVVLTNGSLLWRDEVRRAILQADVIVPNLDAVSHHVMQKINRPCNGLIAEKIIEGLVKLRKEFSKTIILEVFIVPGINDHLDELERIREAALLIHPDCVQLNTIDRPPAVEGIEQANCVLLERVKNFFSPLCVEIIGSAKDFHTQEKPVEFEHVLAIIKRRPSTKEDIINGLGIHPKEAEKILDELLRKGIIDRKKGVRGEFYSLR